MPLLSAVVIAENEAHIIGRSLASLAFCDEIVLVDGGSDDDTVSIAAAADARVILHPSSKHGIHFNKNLGAEDATGEWILSIDADEVVSADLAREIRAVIQNPEFPCYRVARRTWFLGKWIRHSGWWPGYVVRLWKKGHTEWPREVHRLPDPKGPCGTLSAPLDHYSYADMADWIRKVGHFSGCEAVEAWERGERLRGGALIWALTGRPVVVFLRKVVLAAAWRDGVHGLVIAGSSAIASWLRAARVWEIDVLGRKPDLGGRPGRS
jgi:glycosyltransferase involved in cell wall biosynthesis